MGLHLPLAYSHLKVSTGSAAEAAKEAEQAAAEASAELDEAPVTSVLLKVKCNAVRTLASHS